MLTLVALSPIRGIIPIGSSELREVDIIMLAFVSLWAVKIGYRGTIRRQRVVYLLILILVLPAFIGLVVSGKPFVIVLRDVRTPLFFLSILPMLDILRTHADFRRLIHFMVVIGIFSLLVGIAWWLIGSNSGNVGVGQYRFGIGSALSLIVWLVFLAIAFVSFGKPSSSQRKWAWGWIISGIGFIFFANDIRSVYLGVLGGLLFLGGVVFLSEFVHLKIRHSIKQIVFTLFCFCVLLVLSILFAVSLGLDFQTLAAKDMRLSRLYSLVTPFSEASDDFYTGTNAGNRLLGVSYGFDLGIRNGGLGLGYGDNDFVDLDERTVSTLIAANNLAGNPGNTVENLLFTHNSYGWAMGRLGLWLALAYFALILRISFKAWKAMLKTSSVYFRAILFGTLAFVVYILLLGFGGGAFFDYTGQGLILWLVCIAVLIQATKLAQHA